MRALQETSPYQSSKGGREGWDGMGWDGMGWDGRGEERRGKVGVREVGGGGKVWCACEERLGGAGRVVFQSHYW